jgi:hypothetical protein
MTNVQKRVAPTLMNSVAQLPTVDKAVSKVVSETVKKCI